MDFSSLLDYAKQNEKPAKEVKCYRTTFAPPKKEPKTKTLSANIQKFLARKEEEERQRQIEADKKREDLLALRAQDSKANKRVRAMLKSTKAANKAVIDDARDDVNTAVTMAGPSQPDEDDYGYVSQEASAFYNKLMDKYVSTPSEDPKFSKKAQTVKDLVSTKDRVRMALLKEEEEESMGHKRKRKRTKEEAKEKDDKDICYDAPDRGVLEKEARSTSRDTPRERPEPEVKKKRPPAPPPMNFSELLKVAEQKQFEPVKIEKKSTREEDERPMTKKQKEEYMREKQHRMKKEEMARMAAKAKEKQQHSSAPPQAQEEVRMNSAAKVPSIPRIPKLNGAKPAPESNSRVYGNDNEQQMKKREYQQSSVQDVGQVKQRPPEPGRPINNSRPHPSAREQESRSNEARRNGLQQRSNPRELHQERKPSPAHNIPSMKEKRAAIEEKKLMMESPRPMVKEERKSLTPLSKPVIKDERSQMRPTPKPVIKDERGLSSASPKPVIRDDRKEPSNPLKSSKKEEKRPRPPESSRVPLKQVKPISGASSSKYNSPQQKDGVNPKTASSLTRRPEEKPSKNIPVTSGSSLLKDRLTGPSNQSLPTKTTPTSNPQARKDVRPAVHQGQRPGAPVKQPLPVNKLNKTPVNKSQPLGSQGPSRDPQRAPPPERKQMAGRGESRRPMMVPDRGPPGGRFLPPNRPRPQEMRRPAKRRIESDDEYDSELDDFIDDGPEEGEDYSKYIKEIFGYDKSRYMAGGYDDDDDDECMESNFAQQMKEEFVSTKLGIMEDLEDIKQEQMEKKRKKIQMMKKKRVL